MRVFDIITKKKNGLPLNEEEIRFFIENFTNGIIPDYQASALLMAICLKGMNEYETGILTDAMVKSGEMVDLSSIPGIKTDKHSTGGVGDKTTLIIGPIAACCGVPVAKMSGRGLGHTGGTIDKLEAIPGFKTALTSEEFLDIVRRNKLAVISQSANIAPADKKLYALRDVTASIDSIPLLASSIMSKKIASGADAVLLDVKVGSGAFLKNFEDSVLLAKTMVSVGSRAGRRVMALITSMDTPLGNTIGNSLETEEAALVLRNHGPRDLTDICVELAAYMLFMAKVKDDIDSCKKLALEKIENGSAFEKFLEMVGAQGGDISVFKNGFKKAPVIHHIKARENGFITRMDAESCGIASLILGSGRIRKEDNIDHSAGIVFLKKTGDNVKKGETIALLHTSDMGKIPESERILSSAIQIGLTPPIPEKKLLAVVSEENVTYL